MKNLFWAVVALLALIVASGMWLDRQSDHLEGSTIVYAYGARIYEIGRDQDRDAGPKLIYENQTEVTNLSKVDEHRFVFGERRRNGPGKIIVFDRRSNRTTYIADGSAPVYFPEAGRLLFYGVPNGNAGKSFRSLDLSDPGAQAILPATLPDHAYPVLPIGPYEAVFASDMGLEPTLMVIDIRTGSAKASPVERCYPQIWRSATKQLLCFDPSKVEYRLVGEDGGSIVMPDWRHRIWPIAYDEAGDRLVAGRASWSRSIGVMSFTSTKLAAVLVANAAAGPHNLLVFDRKGDLGVRRRD